MGGEAGGDVRAEGGFFVRRVRQETDANDRFRIFKVEEGWEVMEFGRVGHGGSRTRLVLAVDGVH